MTSFRHRQCIAALALAVLVSGCARAALAPWIPKLDLSWRLHDTRARGTQLALDADPRNTTGRSLEHALAATLRWQPTIYAAEVPERYELSARAWLTPCDLDDVTCIAEFVESQPDPARAMFDDADSAAESEEQDVASALQEAQ